MKKKIPLKTVFQSDLRRYSSKKIFGAIGFLASVGIGIACTIMGTQAPTIVVDILYASVILLGVNNITGIWKTRAGNVHKEETRLESDKDDQEEDYNNNYEYTGNRIPSEER